MTGGSHAAARASIACATAAAALFCLSASAGEDPFKGHASISVPFERLPFRPQAPNLPQRVSDLWGDRDRDGGFGELVELPPGFRSPLHAHSGDFHGVLVKGTWVHEDAKGNGISLGPDPTYGRRAERCTSIAASARSLACCSCSSTPAPT